MTDTHTRRRFRRLLVGAGLVAALAAGAPALAGTAGAAPAAPGSGNAAAPAAAAPAAAVTRPGPPKDLTLSLRNGSGARGLAFTARWGQPDLHGGTSPRYVVRMRDDIGGISTQTTTATSVDLFGDRCLAPFTVTVRAQTTDPRTGRTLNGPEVSGRFGQRDLCTINMSITAVPGPARGTIAVTLHHEPPIDPYVSGPCVLLVDGVQRWEGTCGGTRPDQTITVNSQPGRPVDIVLRTTTPRHRVLESNHVQTDAS